MKSNAYRCKAAALAVMLAAGLSVPAYAGDNSMDIWYGDSYRAISGRQNFPHGNPVVDKPPSTLLGTDQSDVTANAQCGPLAREDPFWQPASNGAIVQEEPTATSPEFGAAPAPLFHFGPPNPVF